MGSQTGFLFAASLALSLPAFSQNSASDPDSLFLRALRLQRAGEMTEAKQLYVWVLRGYPRYHDARVQFAAILSSEGRYQEALAHLDSVLFFDPSHVEARSAKARTFAWSGKYRQSMDILQALVEEYPQSVRFVMEVGDVYRLGGATRRALEFYERAFLLNPNDREIVRSLARTHRALGNRDLALYWYKKLLAALPGDDEARTEVLHLTYQSDHELQWTVHYESFTKEGINAHTLIQGEYLHAIDEDWKLVLHGSRVSKFGVTEVRGGAGVYARIAPSVGLFGQGLYSPDATVVPEFDMTFDLNAGIFRGGEALAGYRLLLFDSLRVHIAMPGFTWYLQDDVWLTVRGYFGFLPGQPTSGTGLFALTFRPTPLTTIRLTAFSGSESLRGTTAGEIGNLRSAGGSFGIRSRLAQHIAIDLQYLYSSRNTPSSSHLMTAIVSFLF